MGTVHYSVISCFIMVKIIVVKKLLLDTVRNVIMSGDAIIFT